MAKAVLISSVPPIMVQTDANPGGLPKSVFDDLQAQLAANRSGTLKTYQGFPHGMPTTEAETIDADLLAFIQS